MLGSDNDFIATQPEKAFTPRRSTPSGITTAPERELCIAAIKRMMDYTQTLGMSTSICYWVRKQLQIPNTLIPIINQNGFQCLGYQSKLFQK